jgi:AraC-like DNA-binding protein
MPNVDTLLARAPRFLLERGVELGLSRDAMLRASELGEDEIADPDARVSISKWKNLWRFLIVSTNDPDIGIRVGSALRAGDVGLLGYSMQHSADLGAALGNFGRFFRLWREAVLPHYREVGQRVEIGWKPIPVSPLLDGPLVDWRAAAIMALLRDLTRADLRPMKIHLPYAKGNRDLSVAREYFNAPLKLDEELVLVVLRRRDLDLPIEGANLDLGRYLEQHAVHVIEAMALGGNLAEKVERTLWESMKDGDLSLDHVASALAMSPRTLQRRLRAEGTSFHDMRDGFRHELAVDLLKENALSIYEVAYLLGYSESSNFYRAFRRWEECSPRQFRDRSA